MFLNLRYQAALVVLTMAFIARCHLVPSLDPMGTTTLGNAIFAVNWCPRQFLATGGFDSDGGLIGVYHFDLTTENLSLTVTTTLGNLVNSVVWCPSCTFLAAGGQDSDFNGIIQIYSFSPSNPGNLETVGSSTLLGIGGTYGVLSLDWCHGCSFLAAVAACPRDEGCPRDQPSIIQVYSFNPEHPGDLESVDGSITVTDQIYSIKWCPDCNHLVAAGSFVYIYNFYPEASPSLVLSASIQNNATYNSVDVCDGCSYIAAGGVRNDSPNPGIVDIYSFDSQSTSSLSFVTSVSIFDDESVVNTVRWCQGCDNLVVGGSIRQVNPVLQLYNFYSLTKTLSFVHEYRFGFYPFSTDWYGNCCYLAVGGVDYIQNAGTIQLYRGNTCLIPPTPPAAPTNLTAQKISHRFPTQIDIINKLCWDAVANAVAYNVYADAALTILLATITNPPLCYSQHQICSLLRQGFGGQEGKSATYYVTAVSAQGTQSEPAVVTI